MTEQRDYPDQLGQLAYDAYWSAVPHPPVHGKVPWSELKDRIREAWINAAKAVYERVLTDVMHRMEDQALIESDALQQGLKEYREGKVVDT